MTLFLASGAVLCVDGLTLLELKTSVEMTRASSVSAAAMQRVRGIS